MMKKRQQNPKSIDARIYRYWQAFYMACYSRRLYVDVAKRWKGFGFIYCLLLIAITVIPLSIKSMLIFNQAIGQDLLIPFSKIPNFTISKGELIFPYEMPYHIKNKKGETLIIIDTTGKVTKINEQYPKLVMLFTKNAYYFRGPKITFLRDDDINRDFFEKQEIKTYSFEALPDGKFDAVLWMKESGLMGVKNRVLMLMYPFLVFGLYGVFITFLMMFSIVGQLASYTIFKYKLTFKTACRLTMVSSTIGVCVFLCFKTAQLNSFLSNTLCLTLVFSYFCYAVLSVKRESKQLVLK